MLALGANGRGRAGLLSALRPQDVFATSLYTGTGASQTITNGLDLAGKGGLVWPKSRTSGSPNAFFDTLRGVGKRLTSNSDGTQAEITVADTLTAFNANGFSLGADSLSYGVNGSGNNVAWSFRRAAKFFDIVTYTGDGTSGRVIPHPLGIKPGMIIVKARSRGDQNWNVYHAAQPGKVGFLNLTNAFVNDPGIFGNGSAPIEPTATAFTVSSINVNAAGDTYVAYLFAHDPDTTNGIVQCGSVTTSTAADVTVNLGWPPQWIILKKTNSTSQWIILDTARGFVSGNDAALYANLSNAEVNTSDFANPIATGFTIPTTAFANNDNIAWMAVRAAY